MLYDLKMYERRLQRYHIYKFIYYMVLYIHFANPFLKADFGFVEMIISFLFYFLHFQLA